MSEAAEIGNWPKFGLLEILGIKPMTIFLDALLILLNKLFHVKFDMRVFCRHANR
jgi:hypothetical protein